MDPLIQAALFDLDGVVVFTDRYHYLAWKRLADEQGWDFNEQVNNDCRGVPRMASLQVILDHNGVALPDDRKRELAARKNGYYQDLLKSIDESDLYPGAVEFLHRLRDCEVKLALCSSSKNAPTVLDALELTPLFDTVVTGHDFERPKPDPQIFTLAAGRLGVPAERCIVFEDAEAGVAAALAGGMHCVGVGAPDVLPNAPQTMRDYDEIDLDAMIATGRIRRAE